MRMTKPGLEVLLTPADVAERCQISPKTVLRAIRSGRLRAYRLGARGAYRMRSADVEEWLNDSQVQAVVVPLRAREPTPSPPVPVDDAIRKALAMLQGILQRAVEWERIQGNPVKAVRKPRPERRRAVRPLPPATVEGVRAVPR
jgi:excisionase family DNA binding protein